ncbi:MAG: DUF1830 domain-containing protein [Cyanobacteriota bacterium]
MKQNFASSENALASEQESQILCCYINSTHRIQIIRIKNIPSFYFERVVFPGQRLMFYALAEAKLEIHSSKVVTSILADIISCNKLRVNPANLVESTISMNEPLAS